MLKLSNITIFYGFLILISFMSLIYISIILPNSVCHDFLDLDIFYNKNYKEVKKLHLEHDLPVLNKKYIAAIIQTENKRKTKVVGNFKKLFCIPKRNSDKHYDIIYFWIYNDLPNNDCPKYYDFKLNRKKYTLDKKILIYSHKDINQVAIYVLKFNIATL